MLNSSKAVFARAIQQSALLHAAKLVCSAANCCMLQTAAMLNSSKAVFAQAIQLSAALLAAKLVNSYAALQKMPCCLLQKDCWGNMTYKV